MSLPNLSFTDVEAIVPNCKVVGTPSGGGQKLVFPCEISGEKYALKFIFLNNLTDNLNGNIVSQIDSIRARAEREIDIMKRIDSNNVVKIGPVQLTATSYNNQNLLYYSEEWIEGQTLAELLKNNDSLSPTESVIMCRDIVNAISELWTLNKVHRDIKPQNIMCRASDGSFVLLDLGLAFDLDDKSLTQYGFIPGTKFYLSPEQLDIKHKRDIDFRSDLFSLGVVLYQSLTGMHPFASVGMSDQELFHRIYTQQIIPPIIINNSISLALNNVVCRLLSKQPSGRYRKCSILLDELDTILSSLGVN